MSFNLGAPPRQSSRVASTRKPPQTRPPPTQTTATGATFGTTTVPVPAPVPVAGSSQPVTTLFATSAPVVAAPAVASAPSPAPLFPALNTTTVSPVITQPVPAPIPTVTQISAPPPVATTVVAPIEVPIVAEIPLPVENRLPQRSISTVTPVESSRANASLVLQNYGYTPIGTITVEHKDGRQEAFFKTLGPTGIITIVRIDDNKVNVTVNPNDLSMKEVVNASTVSYSTKLSSYSAVSDILNSVAILCEGGMCIVERNPVNPANMIETNYTTKWNTTEGIEGRAEIANSYGTEVLMDESGIVILPVISLKDIQENSEMIFRFTEMAYGKINERITLRCKEDAKRFNDTYMEMSDKGKIYVNKMIELRNKFHMVNFDQRNMIKVMLYSVPRHINQEEYTARMHLVRKNEEALITVNQTCRALGDLSIKLAEITRDIDALIAICDEKAKLLPTK